jgi:low affinity Fe/Cu permease
MEKLKLTDMNKIIRTSISIIFACNSIFGQTTDEKYSEDVKSVDTIIKAYYDVVSGSSSDPWEFERDTYIHSKNAHIIFLDEKGKAELVTLESLQIDSRLSERKDLYEKELKRKVSQFGNIVQVWSAYEVRNEPETTTNNRGLVSIQLHYEQGRWWIDSWTNQMESDKNSLVTTFLTKE